VTALAHRIRRRRNQRGAAVFIVVLVVTLLTAIGVFAVRSTSLVSTAVGYHRQATQTALLTEYGGRAVTAELGDGAAKTYLDKVGQGSDTCDSNNSLALGDLDASLAGERPACYKLYMSEIADRVQTLSSSNILEAPTTTAGGSLGPAFGAAGQNTTAEGVFVVEMIEPAESVPTAGSAQGGNNPANTFRDVSLTLTAYGQVRPYDTTASGTDPWCAPNSLSASASVSSLRAHVTLKNVPR
jgi:hypothetical protein